MRLGTEDCMQEDVVGRRMKSRKSKEDIAMHRSENGHNTVEQVPLAWLGVLIDKRYGSFMFLLFGFSRCY